MTNLNLIDDNICNFQEMDREEDPEVAMRSEYRWAMKFWNCSEAVNVEFQTEAFSIIVQNITVWKVLVVVIKFVQLIV